MGFVSARREVLGAALLGAAAAAAVATLAPPGGDAAAHLYRTLLVRDGVHVWDNLWYGGQYPFASYSLLYYLPASVVGNVLLVAAATVASAALFAAIAVREWGDAARWPSRVFAAFAAGPLFTGTYSYALGLAAALAALRLLQLRRPRSAVVAGALSLGFSPLAFAFLVLALTAVVAARRRLGRRELGVGLGLAAAAIVELAVLAAFPDEGRYPFNELSFAAVLTVCALGATLVWRVDHARPLAWFFVIWGVVSVTAFLVPTPFGDNLTRLRAFVFPLVLLAAAVARFRPRVLALGAVGFALFYNLAPDVGALPKRIDDAKTAQASFWAPALSFLRGNSSADYRVEVVPTFGHWEAYWVPRAGFALARGWYRQIDLAENEVLYRNPLDPAAYRAWLRGMGIRYVVLPAARLGAMGADREAALLRSGRAGLPRVYSSAKAEIFELQAATRILTGPAPARIDRLEHERIDGWIGGPGRFRLRVRFTPHLRVRAGAVCVEKAENGMTTVVARRGGRFLLVVPESPSALAGSALHRNRTCA
jgi:hypothetical protein